MLTIKVLVDFLAQFPPDSFVYGYEDDDEGGIGVIGTEDIFLGFIKAVYPPEVASRGMQTK